MNETRLYIEPLKNLKKRKRIIYYFIAFMIVLIILTTIISIFHPVLVDIQSAIFFEIIFISAVFIIPYFYYYYPPKRFVIYENGLYTENGKQFIPFKEIKQIKIEDDKFLTPLLKIKRGTGEVENYELVRQDIGKIRKIFSDKGIMENKRRYYPLRMNP
jgi:hypothetical protein